MKKLPTALALVLLFSASVLSAGGGMPSARAACQEIKEQVPGARFERESHFRLGRIAMAFVKPIARWALDEDDEARVILAGIKKVDIATYRVVSLPETLDVAAIRRIESRMLANGWNKIVRSRDQGENTWVFSRHRKDGSISGIFVVDLNEYELTFVGVEGHLDEVLAAAIADEPGEFSGLFGS